MTTAINYIKRYLPSFVTWPVAVESVIADALSDFGGDRDKAALQVLEWAQAQVQAKSETLGDYSISYALENINASIETIRIKVATNSLHNQTPQATLQPPTPLYRGC